MSEITLTSLTLIPQLSFSQFDRNETFKSWVLPESISSPMIKMAAFTFFVFFIHIN